MKALQIDRHEPVEQLKVKELPVPIARENQIVVEVAASGVNPSDVASDIALIKGLFLKSNREGVKRRTRRFHR